MAKVNRQNQSRAWDPSRLRAFGGFKNADDATLDRVGDLLVYQQLPAACLAVEQSQPADGMFLLLSGRVVLALESKDFREMTLEYLDAPAYFGAVGLTQPGIYASNVTACTPVEILELPRSRLRQVIALCEDFAIDLLEMLGNGYSKTVRRLGDNAFLNANERVVSTLGMMALTASQAPAPSQSRMHGHWRNITGVTHSRLASMACTSRETVCRALARLVQDGVVVALPGPPPTRDYLVDVEALAQTYGLDFWLPLAESEEPSQPLHTQGAPAPRSESSPAQWPLRSVDNTRQ